MGDWKSFLKADATDWLLEDDNPSVRYFTLTDILERRDDDPDAERAKTAIMQTGAVPDILAKQSNGGYWGAPASFYRAKYKGSVWQLLILAELGADGKNEKIKKACEFILENSQNKESGGFSPWHGVKTGGGRYSGVIPCLTGNMVWSLIRLGYLDDHRVQDGIRWITKCQRFDDGERPPLKSWPYEKLVMCFGKHSCHMGAIKSLKALAEIPADKRSADVKKTIETGTEYILQHHIHKRSHDLDRVSKPGWLKFGFPLMYQDDVLEILGILTKLGYHDERMQEAIDLVVSKQDDQGRWKLENTFNGKFQVDIEQKDKQSKWITLNALRVLKRFYG